jgi:serralysin
MSGTLTITLALGAWGAREISRTQVGGTGVPDLTVIENYFPNTATRSGLSFDKELYGSSKDDVIVGDNATFFIDGDAGNDTLSSPNFHVNGGDGDDLLQGGEGDNGLYGGSGADTIDGGAGFDVAGYWNGSEGVTVDLRIAGPQQTGVGVDILSNVEGLASGEGPDTLTGDAGANRLTGGAGDDVLSGMEGNDTINGGDPGEEEPDTSSKDFLRGGDGDDLIFGSAGIDDINGNQGNDTVHGGKGHDWMVGGKDDDLLFGDEGADIVYGNLGNDTGGGDAGNDTVRGGQGDDSLTGGAGDDWLSGDVGNDTISGGAGADIFHSFGAAGLDRVTDFNAAEGDRVQLDAGTTYSASQSGADVVVALTGGGQVVLVGVSLASLTDGWIVSG